MRYARYAILLPLFFFWSFAYAETIQIDVAIAPKYGAHDDEFITLINNSDQFSLALGVFELTDLVGSSGVDQILHTFDSERILLPHESITLCSVSNIDGVSCAIDWEGGDRLNNDEDTIKIKKEGTEQFSYSFRDADSGHVFYSSFEYEIETVSVCHAEESIFINKDLLEVHVSHGDSEGDCIIEEEPVCVVEGYIYGDGVGLSDWHVGFGYQETGEVVHSTTTSEGGYYCLESGEYGEDIVIFEMLKEGWDFEKVVISGEQAEVLFGDIFDVFYGFTDEMSEVDFYNIQQEEDTEEQEVEDVEVPVTQNKSSAGGGGSYRKVKNTERTERVLGVSRQCISLITKDIGMSIENDIWEVLKLRMFLNIFMDTDMVQYGGFDTVVYELIKDFQLQHAIEPTGFVDSKTREAINGYMCF